MTRRERHQKKVQSAANRKSIIGMSVGLTLAFALCAPLFLAVPTASPRRMVLAQAVKEAKIKPVLQGQTVTWITPPAALRPVSAATSGNVTTGQDPSQMATGESGCREISFQELSAFPIMVAKEMVEDAATDSTQITGQIPFNVRAFNGKNVSLQGFMLPTKEAVGRVTEFLLLKTQGMCCYGTVPKINEWVNVRTTGKGVKSVMDVPVTISGTFHVGAVRESGSLTGIYELDLDQMKEISR